MNFRYNQGNFENNNQESNHFLCVYKPLKFH